MHSITVNGADVSGGTCSAQSPCFPIVDTGSSLLILPSAAYNSITSVISIPSNCQGINTLPIITITLNGISLELTPAMYVIQLGPTDCFSGFEESNEWIFGATFIRQYYTVFDRGQNAIGFAQLKGANMPAPTTAATQNTPTSAQQTTKNGPTTNNGQTNNGPTTADIQSTGITGGNNNTGNFANQFGSNVLNNLPLIIGVCIGGAICLAITLIIVVIVVNRRNSGRRNDTTYSLQMNPSNFSNGFVPGTPVMARYSGDGREYKAIVVQAIPGKYFVSYPEFGNDSEWLSNQFVRAM